MSIIHYVNRTGWLRAAVLGANDGKISTSSLVIGVAAAGTGRPSIVLAAVAGLTAGAFSMAAGEYVSVNSQGDTEWADLKQHALDQMSDVELKELSEIYQERGVNPILARQVAVQLMSRNALEAHARDEFGINEISQAKPLQAALASFASFLALGLLPLAVAIVSPLSTMVAAQYAFAIVFFTLLGVISARAGGSRVLPAVMLVVICGMAATGAAALVGYIFGVSGV